MPARLNMISDSQFLCVDVEQPQSLGHDVSDSSRRAFSLVLLVGGLACLALAIIAFFHADAPGPHHIKILAGMAAHLSSLQRLPPNVARDGFTPGQPAQASPSAQQMEVIAEPTTNIKAFDKRDAQKDKAMNLNRRFLIQSLLFGGLTNVANPAVAGAKELRNVAPVRTFAVESAALDPRLYRGLTLPNGLRVLLASDPESVTSAAAMNVQVGYFSDPAEFPGLAHFCEHMLFLGTKKYPKEGEFSNLIASVGGSNNAFTAAEDTNYFFDVQAAELEPILDRFAGFFTAPLFTESATSREVNAINSEHSKNLQQTFWRYRQLLALRADQSNPFAKFGTGTRETLRNGDSTARQALFKFHSRYYQADRMALALIGPQPLDTLQKFAIDKFKDVPASSPPLAPASAAYDSLPIPLQPSKSPAEATLMVPTGDDRELKIVWCLPVTDLEADLATKPQVIWQSLLSNRGKGGVQTYLKREGLALGLRAFELERTNSWRLLTVDVALTPLGLTKWREVASLVFAYLRKLRDSGVSKDYISECQTITKTSFDFQESANPQQWATGAAGALSYYQPEKWVTGPRLIADGGEAAADSILQQCADPANAIITLLANGNTPQAKSTEPIYGTRYGTVSISNEVDQWRAAKIPKEFQPPEPNPFIATDFSLKCSSGGRACVAGKRDGSIVPLVVDDVPGKRVHFLQDSIFKRPKAIAVFLFRTNLFPQSPKNDVIASLFASVLTDILEDSTYLAGLAGLGASVSVGFNELSLEVRGYNQRLPEFTTYASQLIRSTDLNKFVFDRQRDALKRKYDSFYQKTRPVALCIYYRKLATVFPRYSIEELAKAVEQVELADVLALQKGLLPDSSLEAFVFGNLNNDEASRMVEAVTHAFPSAGPLAWDSIPCKQIRALKPGVRQLQQFVAQNDEEQDSAIDIYIQIGLDAGDNWLLLGLLGQLIAQPFNNELRTKQQLGYIVQCSVSGNDRARGLTCLVQSSVLQPPRVEERINTFLTDFRAELAALSNLEFNKNRDSLATSSTDQDKTLSQQAGRLWGEMARRRYEYDRPWRLARRIRKLTKQQLLAFYDRYIVPGAPEGRRLVTHVFSKQAAPANLVVDSQSEEFYPNPAEQPLPAAAMTGFEVEV